MNRTGRKTFGVLLDWPDAASNYQKMILQGIRRYAEDHNINLLIPALGRLDTPFSWERNRTFLYELIDNNELIDGFIVLSSALSNFSGPKPLIRQVSAYARFPIVSLGIELPNHPSIIVDNEAGFRELVRHMVEMHEYERIAYISGFERSVDSAIRLKIFRETMSAAGRPVEEDHIFYGDFLVASGRKAIHEFFETRKLNPDAIICANDNMAIGAWQALWERDLAVPDDVAITGFDDMEMSRLFNLPFTTVRQPLCHQGFLAAEYLDTLETREIPLLTKLPTKLVVRHSCGCPVDQTSSVPCSFELIEDRRVDFYRESREILRKGIQRMIKTGRKDPLIKEWIAFLRKANGWDIKQTEITRLLSTLHEEFRSSGNPPEVIELLSDTFEKMRDLFLDFYIQIDLVNRIIDNDSFNDTMTSIDALSQVSLTSRGIEDHLDHLEEALSSSGIETCYLSLFRDPIETPKSRSELIFLYQEGNRREIPENRRIFESRDLLHPEFLPQKRFELIIEAVYEAENKIGTLVMNTGARGTGIYEVFRRQISSILHAVRVTSELTEVNEQLRREVEIRQRTEEKLRDAMKRLKRLSLKDELTGLYNRRGFITLARQQVKYCSREGSPYALFYIDLDRMKQINDLYGHKAGDIALKKASEVLKRSVRETDIIARIGGDEFTVFLADTEEEDIERIEKRIEHILDDVNDNLDMSYRVSLSIGESICRKGAPGYPMPLARMMEEADRQLYYSKKQKRTQEDTEL